MCFEFKISIWAKISDNFGKTSVFFIKADSAVGSAGDQFHHLAVIFSYLLLRVFQALVNFELIIVTHSRKLAVCSSASVLSLRHKMAHLSAFHAIDYGNFQTVSQLWILHRICIPYMYTLNMYTGYYSKELLFLTLNIAILFTYNYHSWATLI